MVSGEDLGPLMPHNPVSLPIPATLGSENHGKVGHDQQFCVDLCIQPILPKAAALRTHQQRTLIVHFLLPLWSPNCYHHHVCRCPWVPEPGTRASIRIPHTSSEDRKTQLPAVKCQKQRQTSKATRRKEYLLPSNYHFQEIMHKHRFYSSMSFL